MLTFEEFKDKLAYQCMVAINYEQKNIRSFVDSARCCCPLGTKGFSKYPSYMTAASRWNISDDQAISFINGFSNLQSSREDLDIRYYNLGLAYNKKFG